MGKSNLRGSLAPAGVMGNPEGLLLRATLRPEPVILGSRVRSIFCDVSSKPVKEIVIRGWIVKLLTLWVALRN